MLNKQNKYTGLCLLWGGKKYVKPITSAIFNDFDKNHKGLDYGSSTGPVITKILTDFSYNIKPYDPYFYNFRENLKEKYDSIVCCEVIEYFYRPYHEFRKLKNLLNKLIKKRLLQKKHWKTTDTYNKLE